MSYQGLSKEFGKVNCLMEMTGQDLIGTKLKAPLTKYPEIYVLPMLTISVTKGTGVVTSVPSDSPDDYAALQDLINKPALRAKYGVTEEMVIPFVPVPIVQIPGYSPLCAEDTYKKYKIKSQNDKEKLKQAKEEVYLKGFYEGVMTVGEHKGMKVQEAKDIIKGEMIKDGLAVQYSEPENTVVSRSGDECVSALTNQWYLTYDDEDWKAKVDETLSELNTFGDEAKHLFIKTLGWLRQWGCSRTYGLGTKLPFDESWMIESLSDSTIYMAYYTIAHFLQGSLDGTAPSPSGIKAEQMTPEVWDYIFLEADMPKTDISADLLAKMRNEFRFWYPLDLRVSGKDLIPNHLTFFLFNHRAMWPKELAPRAVRGNGHVMLNNEKMSKSTGNFLTLTAAIDKYSVDGMRFALADAGDTMEDANFLDATAVSGLLRFYAQYKWIKGVLEGDSLVDGEPSGFWDLMFISAMNKAIEEADASFSDMKFREALKTGFYDLQAARDYYRAGVGETGMKKSLILRFVEIQALLLAPICPHYTDAIWRNLLKKDKSILVASWPEGGEIDALALTKNDYLQDLIKTMRKSVNYLDSKGEKPTCGYLYYSSSFPEWKIAAVTKMKELYTGDKANPFPKTFKKTISGALSKFGNKRDMGKKMGYVALIEGKVKKQGVDAMKLDIPFKEVEFLEEMKDFIRTQLELEKLDLYSSEDADAPDPKKKKDNSSPLAPSFSFT
eukprot:TRINITY_DN1144_c0_g4_i1.p1 TRINITY_DN1144_c0_g4~~TRINITY_DN1144_c0_g4_i1.p1  ORF type:complete len:802 (-),score=148.37 TRINITY_DN1144_c0_g4_i1:83-2251(-)